MNRDSNTHYEQQYNYQLTEEDLKQILAIADDEEDDELLNNIRLNESTTKNTPMGESIPINIDTTNLPVYYHHPPMAGTFFFHPQFGFLQSVPHQFMGAEMPRNQSIVQKATTKKRKRSSSGAANRNVKANSETMLERVARIEQGFAINPLNGQHLKYGPALSATIKDSIEVPVIKTVFKTFQEYHGFTNFPPPQKYPQPSDQGHVS